MVNRLDPEISTTFLNTVPHDNLPQEELTLNSHWVLYVVIKLHQIIEIIFLILYIKTDHG